MIWICIADILIRRNYETLRRSGFFVDGGAARFPAERQRFFNISKRVIPAPRDSMQFGAVRKGFAFKAPCPQLACVLQRGLGMDPGPVNVYDPQMVSLLSCLQNVHDVFSVRESRDRLQSIARQFGLDAERVRNVA